MKYIWEAGKARRVMHIMRHDIDGEPMWRSLCLVNLNFNRSINAPWALGRKVCTKCRRLVTPTPPKEDE